MAQPIEVPFGLRTDAVPRNHVLVLDGVYIPYGKGRSIVKYRPGHSAVICAKMMESIKMRLGFGLKWAERIMY